MRIFASITTSSNDSKQVNRLIEALKKADCVTEVEKPAVTEGDSLIEFDPGTVAEVFTEIVIPILVTGSTLYSVSKNWWKIGEIVKKLGMKLVGMRVKGRAVEIEDNKQLEESLILADEDSELELSEHQRRVVEWKNRVRAMRKKEDEKMEACSVVYITT